MGTHAEKHLLSTRAAELPAASNRRCLEFLSVIEDPRPGRDKLDKLSQPVELDGRRYSGFNLFDPDDENLLCSMVRGQFNISGLQNKALRRLLPELNSGQMSRLLQRLRTHGLRELVIIPQLAIRLPSITSFSCRKTPENYWIGSKRQ